MLSEKKSEYYCFLEKIMKGYEDLGDGFSIEYILKREKFNPQQEKIILNFFEQYKEFYKTKLDPLWHPSKEKLLNLLKEPNKKDYSHLECEEAFVKYLIKNLFKFISVGIESDKLAKKTLKELLTIS